MEIVSARDFRSNQSAILKKVLEGASVLLTSRLGTFKITPVTEEDALTTRIARGLREVKDIRDGKTQGLTVEEFFDEL